MENQQQFELRLNKILNTCFHLPTLITFALLAMVVVWHLYDTSLYFGPGFLRLYTNQGSVTLDWRAGCCALDW